MSTRWYRSPEQLLGLTDYNEKIDIFACGCVIAEICTGCALFTGND